MCPGRTWLNLSSERAVGWVTSELGLNLNFEVQAAYDHCFELIMVLFVLTLPIHSRERHIIIICKMGMLKGVSIAPLITV